MPHPGHRGCDERGDECPHERRWQPRRPNGRGRFARQIRWTPVGPRIAGGTVLASLGPASIMIALQLQLSGLEKTAKETCGVARKILKGMSEDRQDELAGVARMVDQAFEEAEWIRSVTPGVWKEVEGQQAKINEYREKYRRYVEGHVNEARALRAAPAGEVRAHVMENGSQILADLECYMMVERLDCVYRALGVERLREEGRADPKEAELSEIVAASARAVVARRASGLRPVPRQVVTPASRTPSRRPPPCCGMCSGGGPCGSRAG